MIAVDIIHLSQTTVNPASKERTMNAATEFTQGSKLATIRPENGRFTVWVGYGDQNEGSVPARFFKGFTTCSNTYATEKSARKAVAGFLAK